MSLETQGLIDHTTKWIATHGPDFEDVVRKQKHGVKGWEFMDFHTQSKEKRYYDELLAYYREQLKTEAAEIVADVADNQLTEHSRQAEREAIEHVVLAAELAGANTAESCCARESIYPFGQLQVSRRDACRCNRGEWII